MKKLLSLLALVAVLVSCISNDKDLSNEAGGAGYASTFSNVKTINVNIDSKYGNPVYYAVFYEFPYVDGDLAKSPALTGVTPINTTLDVPNDVKKLYVVGNGELLTVDVADINLPSASSKATDISTNKLDPKVVEYINGTCFPEATNNVRGDDLYKCTDLKVANVGGGVDFEEAEVWLTFIGDGGFGVSNAAGQFGQVWFYTYPSEKLKEGMTTKDLTFYGLSSSSGNIIEVTLADIDARRSYIFNSQKEIVNGVSSFKKVLLGKFAKGLNIGFIYRGTGSLRYSTPYLNPKVNLTLTYKGTKDTFGVNGYVSSGFIRHIQLLDSKGTVFEGNVLGLENRTLTESAYDGDHNDMLCLLESNPVALKPVEEIENPTPLVYKSEKGVYLFEDNYPDRGDYDFNDVVVEYDIVDFYTSSNKAKQVAARLLAYGCSYNNTFGFKSVATSKAETYAPFITGIQGYKNVSANSGTMAFGEWVSQAVYGDILPYLENGKGKIVDPTTYNTGEYPYVLDIPYSTAEFMFKWCLEKQPINEAYNFATNRAKDWYLTPKDVSKVVK